MAIAINPSAKLSPSSSHFTAKTLFNFPTSPLFFPSKAPRRFSPAPCQLSENSNSSQDHESTILSVLLAVPEWADRMQERGMKRERSFYSHENWIHHRSSLRHVRHFISILSSRVVLSLVPPVIVFTSVAVIIASYNSAVSMHWLPEFFPILRASSLPYQLTAPALALLLVFRTEASYSRFEEGKKAWTKLIAGTNDFATQVIASVVNPSDVAIKNAILHYIMAFPVALKCHIISGSNIEEDLQNILEVDDLAVVCRSRHSPRCIIELISQSLQFLEVEASKLHMMESKLRCFHEGIESCEHLIGIPIPLAYTRLTSRFLVLWHLTLPVILWDDCHWIVVPATFISAASLFCIEEVGVLIEEPFPMLALDEMCQRVCTNVEVAIRNEKLIHDRIDAKRKSHCVKYSPNGRPTVFEDRQPG